MKVFKKLEKWPKSLLELLCVAMVLLIGMVDYATGYEAIFFIFYLIPVMAAVWWVGARLGVFISVFSVIVWRVSNYAAGSHYSSGIIPVWNMVVIFILFLVVVGLIKLHKELEARVQQRTAALTREMLERKRVEKELLEATEREQRRIGQDLHDSLGQHLTGTALVGHSLGQKLAGKFLPEAKEANRLVELVEEAIELTRTLARGLHPMEMSGEKLVDRFQALAGHISEQFKVTCEFECLQMPLLRDVNVSTHLYRIAQEAINNAVRHGRAKKIQIALDAVDDEIVLTVNDNGAGFSTDKKNQNGIGLRIMSYRAEMMGGVFNIENLKSGTRISCVVPIINYDSKNQSAAS
jgi:signal transduction histidine kinase